jgi:hypothetical protein
MAEGKEGKGFRGRDVIITFKASEDEAEALKHIAEKSGIKVSALIRDLIFKENVSLVKGILYMKKFFEKYASGIAANDDELDKVSDIIDLAEKLAKIYK